MVTHKLAEEGIVFIRKNIIIPQPGADKDLLYTRHRLDGFEQLDIFAVIDTHIRADLRREAVFALAHAELFCLFAIVGAEVRARPADIVYIALEIRHGGNAVCLLHAGCNRT